MTWKERMVDIVLTVTAFVEYTDDVYNSTYEKIGSTTSDVIVRGAKATADSRAGRAVSKKAVAVKDRVVAVKDAKCMVNIREQVAARKNTMRG